MTGQAHWATLVVMSLFMLPLLSLIALEALDKRRQARWRTRP